MAQIILEDSEYTFDASAKTVTLGAPYTGLSVGQIISIIDLKTNDVLYDSNTQRTDAISISGAVITHTHGNTGQADADELQIVIDAGSLNSGTSTSNAQFVQNTNLNPPWAHVLDEKLLNAVTATGRSTFTDVLSYKGLTFCIVASSVTDGATFIFEGSPDADTANVQGLQAKRSDTGAIGNVFNITADGTHYFQIDDAISPKSIDVNLSARTDGTYTVYLTGRAL